MRDNNPRFELARLQKLYVLTRRINDKSDAGYIKHLEERIRGLGGVVPGEDDL